jgi:hypothetical protein
LGKEKAAHPIRRDWAALAASMCMSDHSMKFYRGFLSGLALNYRRFPVAFLPYLGTPTGKINQPMNPTVTLAYDGCTQDIATKLSREKTDKVFISLHNKSPLYSF